MSSTSTLSENTTPFSQSAVRRAITSSIIGNGLEWYDFLIYGFFTAMISKVFFPADDPFVSMLLATATFAVSFLVRPLGGIIVSSYADRYGRKPVMTMMMVVMGVSTILIGLTPSYEKIGIAAPIIIIFARILQGLSVGAEFSSATAMLIEYAPKNRRLYFGSFQMCSQAFALALSGLTGFALSTLMSPEDMSSWGWRIPFMVGLLITPLGFYIRRFVAESPEFQALSKTNPSRSTPFRDVIRYHLGDVLTGFSLLIPGTVAFYVWFVFIPAYVARELQLAFSYAMLSSLISGITLVLIIPFMGHLSDRVGGWRVLVTGVIVFGLLAYPMLHYVIAAPSFERLLTIQIICAIPIAGFWAPMPGLLAHLFPTEVRSTGMSISYNMVSLLFGGLAPFTLTWLVGKTASNYVPAYYVIGCTILSLLAMLLAARIKAK